MSFRKSNGDRLICLKRVDGADDPVAGNIVTIDPENPPCFGVCAVRGWGGGVHAESCLPHTARDEGFVVRSDDGQHRICLVCGEAAALPNALGGQSPAPKFRAEARTHF